MKLICSVNVLDDLQSYDNDTDVKAACKKLEHNYFQRVRVKNKLSQVFMYITLKAYCN